MYEDIGVGELLITSIDNDGCENGLDINLYEQVKKITNLPIIAGGGFGSLQDIAKIKKIKPKRNRNCKNVSFKKISPFEIKKFLENKYMEEVCIINYGLGNVQSLKNALIKCGHKPIVTADNNILQNSKKIILPGVGHFGFAMKKLNQLNLDKTIKSLVRENKKIIAICLGMQLLLETSEEAENIAGLGIFFWESEKT